MIKDYLRIFIAVLLLTHGGLPSKCYSQDKEKLKISVSPLGNGFYVHTSYQILDGQPFPSNGVIANTTSGVVLVDAAWGDDQTEQLLEWVNANLKKKVVLAIITHSHADKIGGIRSLLDHGVRVVSTAQTAARAVKEGYPSPEPVLPARDSAFKIGSTEVHTFYPGEGHAPDNIVVWFPQEKLLAGGCLVKSPDTNNLGNLADANLKEWPKTINTLIKKYPDVTFVIPGHQGWQGKPLEHTLELLKGK